MNYVLFAISLKKQNIKKILEKWQKILEKSGNFVSPKKWEPCYIELNCTINMMQVGGGRAVSCKRFKLRVAFYVVILIHYV